jgi:hypothetical protein
MSGPRLDGFSSVEDLAQQFAVFNFNLQPRRTFDVLIGFYQHGNYEGESFVLLREPATGKLYEVNAYHCSCYGLDGQFEPEETTVTAIRRRLECHFAAMFSEAQLALLRGGLDAIERGEL